MKSDEQSNAVKKVASTEDNHYLYLFEVLIKTIDIHEKILDESVREAIINNPVKVNAIYADFYDVIIQGVKDRKGIHIASPEQIKCHLEMLRETSMAEGDSKAQTPDGPFDFIRKPLDYSKRAGYSCLIPFEPEDLLEKVKLSYLYLVVYGSASRSDDSITIGQAKVDIKKKFVESIQQSIDAHQYPFTTDLSTKCTMYNAFKSRAGEIEIYVRLSCFGKYIFSIFKTTKEKQMSNLKESLQFFNRTYKKIFVDKKKKTKVEDRKTRYKSMKANEINDKDNADDKQIGNPEDQSKRTEQNTAKDISSTNSTNDDHEPLKKVEILKENSLLVDEHFNERNLNINNVSTFEKHLESTLLSNTSELNINNSAYIAEKVKALISNRYEKFFEMSNVETLVEKTEKIMNKTELITTVENVAPSREQKQNRRIRTTCRKSLGDRAIQNYVKSRKTSLKDGQASRKPLNLGRDSTFKREFNKSTSHKKK